MKREISSVDLHFIVKELQSLVGERIDQIYFTGKKDFIFQFRLKQGKCFLRITPDLIFETELKEIKEGKNDFVSILRKLIVGRKISKIEQCGSERLIKIQTDTLALYSYFFSSKDKILCDKNNNIIASTDPKKYKKEDGLIPEEKDLFKISIKEFKLILENIDKNLAKTLAIKLGIGGMYAEELCTLSKLNKEKQKLSDKEKEKVYNSLLELIKKEINPFVIYENNTPVDAIPFEIEKYKTYKKEQTESFNKAIARSKEFFELEIKSKQKNVIFEKEKHRLLTIKELQGKNFINIEKEAEQLHRSGELIYEKYQELKQLLDETTELRKKHSLNEIKDILKKKYKFVKDLNEKEKKVIVEI